MFRAGGDATLLTRSIVLPQSRPKAWPELSDEHCYQLAGRAVEIMPERVRQALGYLAEAQTFHGEQTIEAWADYANRLPEELGGMLAELARCASRAFIELFGCAGAPERGSPDTSSRSSPRNSRNTALCLRLADIRHAAQTLPRLALARRRQRDGHAPAGPGPVPSLLPCPPPCTHSLSTRRCLIAL